MQSKSVLGLLGMLGLLGVFGLSLLAIIYHSPDTPQTLSSASLVIKAGVVQIKADDVDGGLSPIDDLTSALKSDRHSRLFRVSWKFEEGSTSMAMTALYDRQNKTLRLHSVGGMYSTNDPAQVSPRHCLYLGVTDHILQGLANKYAFVKGDSPYSYLDQLPSFGCRKHIFKS